VKYGFDLVDRNHTLHCLAVGRVCVSRRRRIDSPSDSHSRDSNHHKAGDRQAGCLRPNDTAREKGEELLKVIVKKYTHLESAFGEAAQYSVSHPPINHLKPHKRCPDNHVSHSAYCGLF